MGYEAGNPVSQIESRVLCFLDKSQTETCRRSRTLKRVLDPDEVFGGPLIIHQI
jgi:hypothetical protein